MSKKNPKNPKESFFSNDQKISVNGQKKLIQTIQHDIDQEWQPTSKLN